MAETGGVDGMLLLLALLLAWPVGDPTPLGDVLIGVHGDREAPAAWAVVRGGSLLLCWDPAPGCFRRVAVEEATSEPGQLETGPGWSIAFLSPSLAAVVDPTGRVWSIEEGRAAPRPWPAARELPSPTPRRPTPARCGPRGLVPALDGGELVLAWKPCADAATRRPLRCPVARPALPPRPGVVHPRVSLSALVLGASHAAPGPDPLELDRRRGLGVALLLGVELEVDRSARQLALRQRAALARASPTSVALPSVPPGPLASAERDALWRALCTSVPPWPDPSAPSRLPR